MAIGTASWIYLNPQRNQVHPESVPIRVAALVEASGLAASHRTPDLLWSHNDSGGQPVLYGFSTNGGARGSLRITGAKAVDWEAISSFEMDGKAWIAIGDVGDNLSWRKSTTIYVVEEPAVDRLSPLRETPVPIAWSIVYHFEDGPRDCEALLVDPRLREILLISKRGHPAEVYTLPLRPSASTSGVATAKKIGRIAHVPQPNFKQKLFPSATGRFRGQVTDGCISADGLSAALLTYGDVLIYRRRPAESWADAFQKIPERLAPHGLSQAEALCYSADGNELFITGEQKHPILLRYVLLRPGS